MFNDDLNNSGGTYSATMSNSIHNEAVKAMRYPPDAFKIKNNEEEETKDEKDREDAKREAEEDEKEEGEEGKKEEGESLLCLMLPKSLTGRK